MQDKLQRQGGTEVTSGAAAGEAALPARSTPEEMSKLDAAEKHPLDGTVLRLIGELELP